MLNLRKMIPTIMTSQEIIDKAFRRIVKVDVESAESKLEMVREKSLGRLNSATDTITEVLIKYHHAFPSVNKKEGFLVELMCVVIDMNRLKQALSKLQWATKKIRDLRRIYMIKIKEARNLDELDTVRKQFYGRMCSVVNRLEGDLKFMAAAREEFRKIPMVDETDAHGGDSGIPERREEPAGGTHLHGPSGDRPVPFHHPGDWRRSFLRRMAPLPGHRYPRASRSSAG